ncbi:hypothetical protein C0J50_15871 [Silurus asotus]|uniref:RNase H type-1 domain-containing protein n=1 Tax=Silurus asotus TaxID=30991 RepID=A0AAD5AWV3_SILAS|nr:hypothetical protein C0J50_15871 [Silurus asotus]
MVDVSNQLQTSFLIDTGATFTSIGKEGSKLPLSGKAVKTVGFSGKTQTLHFTEPQDITVEGITIQAPLLYSPDTPAGFSRPWICDFALKTQPLRDMMKAADQTKSSARLIWTEKGKKAFETIKSDLRSAPALACPDYTKPFHLYVSEKQGFASAILAQQQQSMGKKPIAYYSTALDNVEKGMPPCYRGLAAAAFAYQKASRITMGHPVTQYTSHALYALLTSQKFVITNARRTGYDVILSAPELTIERCLTINPADRVVLSDEGLPHECTTEAETFLKARDDLESQPLQDSQIVLFVDGSCYCANDGNKSGYAVVMHDEEDDSFRVLASVSVPQPCSAQLAEIKELTAACRLGAGGRCTIYTDSAYAHGVCHTFGPIWEQRGFQRADGSSILHGPAISDLLKAMMLPKALAIVKCKAHKSAADEAAKSAAVEEDCVKVIVQDEEHEKVRGQVTEEDLGEYQDVASGEEKERWKKRGAVQDPNTGLWRSVDGVWVAPLALLPKLIAEAHGVDHCNRRETIDTIRRNWWSPYLASIVDKFLRSCELCAARNVRKHFTAPISHIPEPRGPFRHLMIDFVDMADRKEGKRYILVREATHGAQVDEPLQQVQPGDYVYIKVFKRKHWSEPQREGPFKVVLATSTAVKGPAQDREPAYRTRVKTTQPRPVEGEPTQPDQLKENRGQVVRIRLIHDHRMTH